MKVISVVGARPNFMKIAPIIREFKKNKKIQNILVHTGQHYDRRMSKMFFDDLAIPKPDINLGVGSETHARQTAAIMVGFEKVLVKHQPNLVLVVGDVNSTLACSVTASKLNIPVAHVEAGLRSFDRSMPEEINRVVTDSISDLLFTTSSEAKPNLKREGVDEKKVFYVGNVMIDSLIFNLKKAKASKILKQSKVEENKYCLVTLHRPSNVDTKKNLKTICQLLTDIQGRTKIVFPIHPRTAKNLEKYDLLRKLKEAKNIILLDPLGYLDFLKLMASSQFVLTDSGGIQEETTYLNVPCVTLRENTERPVTVTKGTNYLLGLQQKTILKVIENILKGKRKRTKKILYWDGKAAQRITKIIVNKRVSL